MSYRTLIDCRQLAGRLGDPDWRIFDCRFDLADTARGERDYRVVHVPGAIYAHLDRDLSGPITPQSGRHPLPDPGALCRWLGSHGIRENTQIVAYDDSGGTMAVRLWWLLRWLGHVQVALLDGGWQAWHGAMMPMDQALPSQAVAADFHCLPDWRQVATSDEIMRQAEDGGSGMLLIDARSTQRFRGEVEPIDPVAGHVPGATNLPLQRNLAADGRFLPARDLRALYQGALAGRPAHDVVVMCGSGVTACHNLLAMEIAGLPGGRLYAGSWSEWIRDPSRPVATGDARGA
jgi:thiosulfate/3-mercaptopyruvate sulfurtransferase